MMRLQRALDLPLVAKELNELAARRQTYVVRFVYAALLFGGACVLFYGNLFQGATRGLGQGRFMFENLLTYQFWAICLFLPATSSGVLTAEKERNALGLIMLTTLRPWEIVVQKFLGRQIPMLSFLLLSLPLMAIAYSYGGVTQTHLWAGILLLFVTSLEIGALAVMCSAYFRTTAEAFVATYVLFPLLLTFPPFWVPWILPHVVDDTWSVLAATIPMLALTGGSLLLARAFLESRAFVPARNLLLEFFRGLDAYFNNLNALTGGIVLVKDTDVYPADDPVAWRETKKKSLGTFRYLFRVLVALELPVLVTCELMRYDPTGAGLKAISTLLYVVWVVALAIITVHAASVVSSERARQTLDVLLTTPLTGAEIIQQKSFGVRRLIAVLLIPFVTIFLLENWWYGNTAFGYLAASLLCVGVNLPLAAWLAVSIGLVVRSQMRAILLSVAVLTVWAVAPPAVRYVISDVLRVELPAWSAYVWILSPADVIRAIETSRPSRYGLPASPWLFYAIHFVCLALIGWSLRRWCLTHADRRLGRIAEKIPPTTTSSPVE
jgi:ABC-type transport system involved in multi-copper enzyme maturation permease subunit